MIRMRTGLVAALLVLASSGPVSAKAASVDPRLPASAPRPVTPGEIEAHLRFLAGDLLEGRGVGTRGGRLAEEYIEAVLRQNGLAPAFGSGYRQEFDLRRSPADPGMTLAFSAGGKSLAAGTYGAGFVAAFPRPETAGSLAADLVFAGYGIVAPEYAWDDYAGADVAGKVVVVLSEEPGGDDPTLFEGRALTVHGRWTTKLEVAARHGARGALIVHDPAGRTHGWEVVRNGWARGRVHDPTRADLLELEGWLSEETGAALARLAGRDLASLRDSAARRGFRPVPLGVRLSASSAARYETARTANIAGVVRGAGGPGAPVVVVSAHHDHLGLGLAEGGDAIYNGAIDNGSALAALLALARFVAEGPPRPVDVLFLAPGAEEDGLLGSTFFTRNPPLPLARIAADLNLELTSVWGEAKDVVAIGAGTSQLGDVVAEVAAAHAMTVAPEPDVEKGFFFRSDQFPFARAGIPAAWIDLGTTLSGRPEGEGRRLRDAYLAHDYHHARDAFDPSWELTGTAQLCRLLSEMVDAIGRRGGRLEWRPGSPFRRPVGRPEGPEGR